MIKWIPGLPYLLHILLSNSRELASRSGRVPDSRSVFSLIFLKSKLRNNISKLLKFQHPEIKLQFIYKLTKRLSSFLNIRTSSHLLCVLMLSISIRVVCSSWNASYYGKTARNLKVLCCEHQGIINRAHPSTSSIWDHVKQPRHTSKLEDFSISVELIIPSIFCPRKSFHPMR